MLIPPTGVLGRNPREVSVASGFTAPARIGASDTARFRPTRTMFKRFGRKICVSSIDPNRVCEICPVMTKSVASGDVVLEFAIKELARIESLSENLWSRRPVQKSTFVAAAETKE